MKQVINGKLYNTETAQEICSCQYGYPRDFDYVLEELYRKKNGEFFLHTCGGPASRYRVKTGCNEYTGNQQIIPVDINTAKDFTEKNGSVDDYINLFGMPEE